MTLTTTTSTSPSVSPIPRLRLEPTGSTRTLLDGGWWPRSTDPATELPGLILAIDAVRGPITRLVLSGDGWNPRPRRLAVAGRSIRLGYFTSQPTALLTARCNDGDRVDLLVVPPDTARPTAEAAMARAATVSNRIHSQRLLAAAANTPTIHDDHELPEQVWETEGGRLHTAVGPGIDEQPSGSRSRRPGSLPAVTATPTRSRPTTIRWSTRMEVAKSRILAALRERGQDIRAEWVDRDLPDRVDTVRNAGLLAILHLSPADLADKPSP